MCKCLAVFLGRSPGKALVSALGFGISTEVHHLGNKVQHCGKKIQNLKDDGRGKNKGSQSKTLVTYIKTTYLNKELWNTVNSLQDGHLWDRH